MEAPTARSASTGGGDAAADSDDARTDALRWAETAREVRHGVRAALRSGAVSLSDVLADASHDDLLGRLRLLWVLESLPGARKIDTRRTLGRLGVDGDRSIGNLDDATLRTVRSTFAPEQVDR